MPASSLSAASPILDSAAKLIDNAIDMIGEEAVAAYLYEAYVKFDIPYVPDGIEAMVIDPMVKPAIVYAVKRIHATVHKGPAPAPATSSAQ